MKIIFIDLLGPLNLVLFILLLEVVILNLNVKKCHMEFWGKIWCSTALYVCIYTPVYK